MLGRHHVAKAVDGVGGDLVGEGVVGHGFFLVRVGVEARLLHLFQELADVAALWERFFGVDVSVGEGLLFTLRLPQQTLYLQQHLSLLIPRSKELLRTSLLLLLPRLLLQPNIPQVQLVFTLGLRAFLRTALLGILLSSDL